MSNRKILFVLTGHDRLGPANDESADTTGFHLSEAAEPWAILRDAGFEVELVTPKGGAAPIDPGSRDTDNRASLRFLEDETVRQQLSESRSLREVSVNDYEAIYFPGGHGTMWDLPDDPQVQTAIRTLFQNGKVVAAVCHGPAAFVNVELARSNCLVDGRTLSVFTDAEEKAVEKDELVPFLLESKLKERGAKISSADNFDKAVSVDDTLITGQNPASAKGVGEAIRDIVKRKLDMAA